MALFSVILSVEHNNSSKEGTGNYSLKKKKHTEAQGGRTIGSNSVKKQPHFRCSYVSLPGSHALLRIKGTEEELLRWTRPTSPAVCFMQQPTRGCQNASKQCISFLEVHVAAGHTPHHSVSWLCYSAKPCTLGT